jgi:hypothetical protein
MRIRSHIRNNIVGYVALFFALCGVAYAGVPTDGPLPGQDQVGSLDIIDGQVFGKDIQPGTIGSGKIANDSLTADDLAQHSVGFSELDPSDFASADIAQNCRIFGVCRYEIPGNAIQTGEIQDGQVTKADLASDAAPDGYSAFDDDTGIICNAVCTEGSLKNLPAGSYAISAKITVEQQDASEGVFVGCKLNAGADFDNAHVDSDVFSGEPGTYTIPMQVVHTFASDGGAASVNCADNDVGNVTGSNLKITAIRLGSLSNVHSTSAPNR